jgi:redox-sensitive bicupin YhaK (pirin superfamily)
MSAGTGIRHSEFNHSKKDPVHLIQLWILPAVQHLRPSWEQKSFSLSDRMGKLLPIAVPASQDGNPNSTAVRDRCITPVHGRMFHELLCKWRFTRTG